MSIQNKVSEKLKTLNVTLNDDVNDKSLRVINKVFRLADESHLFPINGAFNATNRAINRYRKYFQANGPCTILEYILGLENEISQIVNTGF